MKTETLLQALKDREQTLATAESCTGGGIGTALTAIPGSSAAYAGGIISYTNAVKHALLGVPQYVLDTQGAVSEETALAMAKGVRSAIGADFGLSVTGLAGPDGDGSKKPVGLVYIGIAGADCTVVQRFLFSGNRQAVRKQAVDAAITLAAEFVQSHA